MGHCPICKESHVYRGYTECRNQQENREINNLFSKLKNCKINVVSLDKEANRLGEISNLVKSSIDSGGFVRSEFNTLKTGLSSLRVEANKFGKNFSEICTSRRYVDEGNSDLINEIELYIKSVNQKIEPLGKLVVQSQIYASNEESENQPKFAKNTPRPVRRIDRMSADDWSRVK
jgi:hypothetical protein